MKNVLTQIAYACDNVSPMAPAEDLRRLLKKIHVLASAPPAPPDASAQRNESGAVAERILTCVRENLGTVETTVEAISEMLNSTALHECVEEILSAPPNRGDGGTEALLLLKAIADETCVFDNGPKPYSGDSYLPMHLKEKIRAVVSYVPSADHSLEELLATQIEAGADDCIRLQTLAGEGAK